jgi:aldose 1-epimerase
MINKKIFGHLENGCEVNLYSLKNKCGTTAEIINYGACVKSINVENNIGNFEDVVLGYDTLDEYINDKFYFGATVGRYANRIAFSKFSLNGTEYKLNSNDGNNHLHGGLIGFNKVLWNSHVFQTEQGSSVKLEYLSKDGEENYPGNLKLSVLFTLTDKNEIIIKYEGVTDEQTILNMTNHSYFNLSGNLSQTILEHELFLNSESFTPVNKSLIPTGEIKSILNTPLDFLQRTQIGLRINDDYEQIKLAKGFDHNWIINNYQKEKIRMAATVYEPQSGRIMEVFTDQPGLQFYSGNFLRDTIIGKNGTKYNYRSAFCLEAQHYPDSPNQPEFPSVVLNPGELYKQKTIYKFSTIKNN